MPDSGSNLLFCMESDVAATSSSHAYLVPDSFHLYPLQLHIFPESNENLNHNNLNQTVSTSSAEQCAYLSCSINTTTISTMVDCLPSLAIANDTLDANDSKQSIQTTV